MPTSAVAPHPPSAGRERERSTASGPLTATQTTVAVPAASSAMVGGITGVPGTDRSCWPDQVPTASWVIARASYSLPLKPSHTSVPRPAPSTARDGEPIGPVSTVTGVRPGQPPGPWVRVKSRYVEPLNLDRTTATWPVPVGTRSARDVLYVVSDRVTWSTIHPSSGVQLLAWTRMLPASTCCHATVGAPVPSRASRSPVSAPENVEAASVNQSSPGSATAPTICPPPIASKCQAAAARPVGPIATAGLSPLTGSPVITFDGSQVPSGERRVSRTRWAPLAACVTQPATPYPPSPSATVRSYGSSGPDRSVWGVPHGCPAVRWAARTTYVAATCSRQTTTASPPGATATWTSAASCEGSDTSVPGTSQVGAAATGKGRTSATRTAAVTLAARRRTRRMMTPWSVWPPGRERVGSVGAPAAWSPAEGRGVTAA